MIFSSIDLSLWPCLLDAIEWKLIDTNKKRLIQRQRQSKFHDE